MLQLRVNSASRSRYSSGFTGYRVQAGRQDRGVTRDNTETVVLTGVAGSG